ncbi:MAG: UPF0182 family membrane protein [Leptospirales bacterium]
MSPRTPWYFLATFAILLFSFQNLMDLDVDYLWYRSVHHPELFWIYLIPRFIAALVAAAIFFISGVFGIFTVPTNNGLIIIPQAGSIRSFSIKLVRKILLILIFILSIMVGDHFSQPEWTFKLLSLWKGPLTPQTDPVFHHNISLYLFRLPVLESLVSFLLMSMLFSLGIALVLGRLNNSWKINKGSFSILPSFRKRLFPFLSLISLCLAVSVHFSRFDLLTHHGELMAGPGYTDSHATIPALYFLEILLILNAVFLLIAALKGSVLLPLATSILSLITAFIGVSILPSIVERFVVLPDQFHYEKPFLNRNITWTRKAYNLDTIETSHISHLDGLTPDDLKGNEQTIENIRLWDHRPLLTTVRQLQQIRTYYQFPLVSPDRYNIDGKIRQVLVAPRELSYENLPSPNWINLHLAYTHGHGLIMTPVNRVTSEGLPSFWIKNIPPQTRSGIQLTHSRIYFGDQSMPYAIVNTSVGEFDYPRGNSNIYNHYTGSGGVNLNGFNRKLLFSYAFGTLKIFLSNAITPSSRILFHRNIFDIIHQLAPYLTLDPDPVPIITSGGKLLWMVDAYTTSNHYPYSTATPGARTIINAPSFFQGGHFKALTTWPTQFNYIRNSVKILVDPINGFPEFYVTDPNDPILKTYRILTPELFKPLSDIPADIQEHLRFPPAIFSVMARVFESYHMTDPHTFFNKEDIWSLPRRDEKIMSPYYTVMRIPGGSNEEYVLMLPYTPAHRQNLSAWLIGRSDGTHLGKMTVYTFPKERLIYGPDQIEARIDQRGSISKQLTLWNQQGSHVVRGTLLIIPIANTLLYVEPLYLEATSPGALPELRRVILAEGNRVVMRKTLLEALEALFSGGESGNPADRKKVSSNMSSGNQGNWKKLHQLAHDAKKALRNSDLSRFGSDVQSILEMIQKHP